MPLKDLLYMQPLQKYEKHGRFPWKLTIHMLLVVFTTLQILLISMPLNAYSNSQLLQWNQLFLDKEVEPDNTSLVNSYKIFSLAALEEYLNWTVEVRTKQNYYDIDKYAMGNYHHVTRGGEISPIKMKVKYLDLAQVESSGYHYNYEVTRGNSGLFNVIAPKMSIEKIEKFQLEFELKHKVEEDLNLASKCFLWKLTQSYSYSMQGIVIVTLSTDLEVCPRYNGKA
jgi:hypothetical protein